MTPAKLFNKHEVAAQLSVSEFTVRRLARLHGIGFRMGGNGAWRFAPEDVEALVEAMRAPREEAS